MTCIHVLDNYFLEVNPVHLRRKQFFEARQKEGQSIIEFLDELLSLIDEAEGANIGVNDLVCMMLQIGVSDTALQRELGAIKNPTLPAYNMKIEGQRCLETLTTSNPTSLKTVAHLTIGERVKGTVASHCADVVFAVRRRITCYRSALIPATLSAIFGRSGLST